MPARLGRATRVDGGRRGPAATGLIAPGLLALALVAGCSAQAGTSTPHPQAVGSAAPASSASTPSSAASVTPSPAAPVESVASISTNVRRHGVTVDRTVTLTAARGTLRAVTVHAGPKGLLRGSLSENRRTWTSSTRLEPGVRYRVRAVAVDADGRTTTKRSSFTTQDLSLDQQTYPSFFPQAGSTVGVGMPVVVRFDVAVHDRAAIQKHLRVTNSSGQKGAWHWISDYEVHWRPVHYWKSGTDVTVAADINSVPAGQGIYGQLSRTSTFHVGDRVVSHVNAATDQMRTFVNGHLARTIPITTGKPGFTTRSGVKVIVEKFRHKRMNSETIGIDPNSAQGYDLDDVEYAMRVTYSGEFLHAAPWSVASQGSSNVSHGCTGMSTSNAAWLYAISKPGDVVDYTGTDRPMTLDNGLGDWNEPFTQYQQGSALS